MSGKAELYESVDRLEEERVPQVLAYLQRLASGDGGAPASPMANLNARMSPIVVSGIEFFSRRHQTLGELAERQGVRPVQDFDALLGDFWPEDETADEFIATVRQWRAERGNAR